ncbi:DegV family EDD domain-containing protein [Chitinimonas arctica]|uniref:DegV family EDD domain-containing protein n=1 Tax=Chitinimonas arctica TaxID=2594795 RepID=A0A516SJT1_9NEIS|nr:DegV family protein [Chitinimonas arctica]QDQ28400.1 DegV family EDD domain-containing protein [Chitinimonas arctica]
MRIGIATDSACDLPRQFLDKHKIVILPVSIKGPQGEFVDNREPAETLAFYRSVAQNPDAEFSTRPFSPDEIRDLFLSRLVLEFDYVFCITVMKTRSLIFENASHASLRILSDYRPIREAADIKAPFSLRVFDSATVATGQGLVVGEVARLVALDTSTLDIIRQIERLTQHTQAFLMPADLGQLRSQARRRGDKSVGFLTYALGSALDIKPILRAYRGDTHPIGKVRGYEVGCNKLFDAARSQIRDGQLLAPLVNVSYGGDTAEVEKMAGYQALLADARPRGIAVHLSEMSSTACVNIGVGGLSVAFASERETTFD